MIHAIRLSLSGGGRIAFLCSAAAAGQALVACGPAQPLDWASDTRQRIAEPAQCGPSLDLTPINAYSGDWCWVQCREEAVAFINGNCTGTYIGTVGETKRLVLTAGHCVGLGDEALVVFNYEADADGSEYFEYGTVVEVSEVPDYALIELALDPGVSPAPLGSRITETLAIIQHPLGGQKSIAEGRLAQADAVEIHYADLDTLLGSSGAGVFNKNGRLIGVHGGGDCAGPQGTNFGWAITAITDVSPLLSRLRLDDL